MRQQREHPLAMLSLSHSIDGSGGSISTDFQRPLIVL